MAGPHEGRTGDSQHEPDEVAIPDRSSPPAPPDYPEMSERVAAVVQAFHALRERQRLPDSTPAITPPGGTDPAPPPAGPGARWPTGLGPLVHPRAAMPRSPPGGLAARHQFP